MTRFGRHREAVLVVEHPQRLHRVVVVVQRLTHPHEHDVELRRRKPEFGGEHAHLAGNFTGGEVSDQSHLAGQAEAAFHGASDLRGDAERLAWRVGDENRFDAAAIFEAQEKLHRPVRRRLLLDERRRADAKVLGQVGSELPRQICHLLEVGHALRVDPSEDLPRVKARMPAALERGLELGEIHRRKIGSRRLPLSRSERWASEFYILDCTRVKILSALSQAFLLQRVRDLRGPTVCTAFVITSMIVRDALDNGIRLVTESMSHVRSVSLGVWLSRGSRHETDEESGIAHFVEHMLFKGTATRTAEEIAQAVDSIGGQLDAFTAKEYASYYVKVLDEHLPLAVDILSDIVLRPAFHEVDIEREKKVILEEIKMVEDTPDDLVHEIFTQAFWEGHPLGRPILGTKESVEAITQQRLRDHFRGAYAAENVIISAAGNLEHSQLREALEKAFGSMPSTARNGADGAAARRAEGRHSEQRAGAEPRVPRARPAIRRITATAMRAT